MFQEIQPHLQDGTTLNLAVSVLPTGELNVVIDQKSGAALAGHQLPKALTATAAEFDESLTEVLVKYLSVRRSLSDQIKDLEVVAQSIAEDARATAQASASKSAASVQRPKSKTPVPPALLDASDGGDHDNDGASNGDAATSGAQQTAAVKPQVAELDFGL